MCMSATSSGKALRVASDSFVYIAFALGQQLSGNLQFDTLDKGIGCGRRFVNDVNEFPWNGSLEHIEQYFGVSALAPPR